MRKLLVAACLMMCGTAAQAAGWTPPLTVETGTTESSNDLIIVTSGGAAYSPGCSVNHWVFRATNDAQRGRAWATVLTALASGLRIQLWYTDACGPYSYHDTVAIKLVRE